MVEPQRRSPIRLGDLHPQQQLVVQCIVCRHKADVDHGAWRARFGASMSLLVLHQRLSCQQCGARPPLVGFVIGPVPESEPVEDAAQDGGSVQQSPRQDAG